MVNSSKLLLFNVKKLDAFELFILKGLAHNIYRETQKAKVAFEKLIDADKIKWQLNIIADLPDIEESYTIKDFIKVLQYHMCFVEYRSQ